MLCQTTENLVRPKRVKVWEIKPVAVETDLNKNSHHRHLRTHRHSKCKVLHRRASSLLCPKYRLSRSPKRPDFACSGTTGTCIVRASVHQQWSDVWRMATTISATKFCGRMCCLSVAGVLSKPGGPEISLCWYSAATSDAPGCTGSTAATGADTDSNYTERC